MDGYMTIKHLPFSERPYEKLEKKGAKSLSDAELLAIILKTGLKNERSTDMAARVLSGFKDGLLSLHNLTIEELMQNKGIGRVKAIQLKAVAELSDRINKERYKKLFDINSPKSVADCYMESLRHLENEKIIMLSLNSKNQIIQEDTLSIGTVSASLVNSREVFKKALKNNAVGIILLHNHPSGNPTPSRDDLKVTREILTASDLIGIKLLDHIVIGDGSYVSLKEQGII